MAKLISLPIPKPDDPLLDCSGEACQHIQALNQLRAPMATSNAAFAVSVFKFHSTDRLSLNSCFPYLSILEQIKHYRCVVGHSHGSRGPISLVSWRRQLRRWRYVQGCVGLCAGTPAVGSKLQQHNGEASRQVRRCILAVSSGPITQQSAEE